MRLLRNLQRIVLAAVGAAAALIACASPSRDGDRDTGEPSAIPPSPPPAASSAAPPDASSAAPPTSGASAAASAAAPPPDADGPEPTTLADQRAALLRKMANELSLSGQRVAEVKAIIEGSPYLGQGNPTVTRHPMTRAECRSRRTAAGLNAAGGDVVAPCDAKNMAPLYDPGAGETAANAKVCIDQFEFPDIPCEYPVVYARANEAADLCRAVGKRICDAHEWEGACAGAIHRPEVEYHFDKPRPYATWLHNKEREIRWAYGKKKDHAICATGTVKSPKCEAGGWTLCGSNTYPAGAFPACVSPLGVYDQHGNAAEHMNLPLAPEELASRGGTGATEMKGSWFIFLRAEAHEDDCRWRAKDWHPSRLMAEDSHRNYHLGFRCCKDVQQPGDAGAPGEDASTP